MVCAATPQKRYPSGLKMPWIQMWLWLCHLWMLLQIIVALRGSFLYVLCILWVKEHLHEWEWSK